MYQRTQVNKEYLQDIQFFKATNDFSAELAQLEKEQEQDLSVPVMEWWVQIPMTEQQYFNELAEANGELS